MRNYFTKGNPKTQKGEALGYDTLILHLAPADEAGIGNACPLASPGCKASCLNRAGRGAMASIQSARVRRTKELFPAGIDAGPCDPAMDRMIHEIDLALARAEKKGRKLAIRLNGTSDLPWETYSANWHGRAWKNLMAMFPAVQFYDYTKNPVRMRRFLLKMDWPSNYHLTFSRSEDNGVDIDSILRAHGNVAVVSAIETDGRPKLTCVSTAACRVVDGNAHDLTFLHAPGSIIWLTPKGPARHDSTGFVLR